MQRRLEFEALDAVAAAGGGLADKPIVSFPCHAMAVGKLGRMAAHANLAVWEREIARASGRAMLATRPSQAGPELSIADAYVISHRILHRREREGWLRVGRKIGFTNAGMMRRYGVAAPIFGYMYDRTVTNVDADCGQVALDGLVQPRIEPEIVFKLRRPLTSGDPLNALRCIEWMAFGFELVHCHFSEWKFSAAETIVDGGLHGRLVIGPPSPIDSSVAGLVDALAGFHIALSVNGAVVATGGGAAVLGSPLNALLHLVDVLGSLPGHPRLEPGELITTGTLTPAMPVAPVERWSVAIDGLPVKTFALTTK